jgi:hypothetical protein
MPVRGFRPGPARRAYRAKTFVIWKSLKKIQLAVMIRALSASRYTNE